jgi:hypothetical protein
MSLRPGAPYADQVEDEGRVLIYEGHDVARTVNGPHPKQVDQPERNPGGSLTQNGLFAEAVQKHKEGAAPPERVRVYEKVRSGIWVYNGLFALVDCWTEQSGGRKVFKFKLQFAGTDDHEQPAIASQMLEDDRLIPSWVKLEVWKRDRGRCKKCGTTSGLHFDHIIPYSKGGDCAIACEEGRVSCGRSYGQLRLGIFRIERSNIRLKLACIFNLTPSLSLQICDVIPVVVCNVTSSFHAVTV